MPRHPGFQISASGPPLARNTIKYVDAPVAKNQWHALRVEFAGKRIRVALDGKVYIEVDDERIAGPGRIGVWTKADSFTGCSTTLLTNRPNESEAGARAREPDQ
jgi:hypothetical protein